MKALCRSALALATALAPGLAAADGYVMGSGRWTCTDVLAAWQGTDIDKGQMVGWILGYWSAETFSHDGPFVASVEAAGAENILASTLSVCGENPEAQLHDVVRAMVANTAAG